MGMVSYFDYEDIEVKDYDGLKTAVNFFCDYLEKKQGDKDWADMFRGMLDDKDRSISFDSWDNIKLISYWYDNYLIFLKLIAPYVEGRVDWNFESKDEGGYVEFTDGECEITTGQMKWNTWKPDEEMREDLDEELKRFMTLQKLEVDN